jgi:hypothetical protein
LPSIFGEQIIFRENQLTSLPRLCEKSRKTTEQKGGGLKFFYWRKISRWRIEVSNSRIRWVAAVIDANQPLF